MDSMTVEKSNEEKKPGCATSDVQKQRELCEKCKKLSDEANHTTTIHLIRSVKGGSGKTTYALHKAMDLAENYGKDECKVLCIDADVHASETMNMLVRSEITSQSDSLRNVGENFYRFFRFSKNGAISEDEIKLIKSHTLNTYMHSYKGYYSEIRNIIHHATIMERYIVSSGESSSTDDKPIGKVDFIFSDYKKEGRSIFENMYQSSGKSVVGVGTYTAKMISIIDFAIAHGYNDVIIDMPPGSDTFSSHLAEIVTDRTNKEKCELKVYYVVNNDIYHFNAAKTAMLEHLHVMRSNSPCEVVLIYNIGHDRSPDEGKGKPSLVVDRKTVMELLKKSDSRIADNFELSRIKVEVFEHDRFYYLSTTAKWALEDNSAPVFWPKK